MIKRLLPLLLLALPSAYADDLAALTTRLLDTQTLSSLDDPALKPWHLKLDVQLFDFRGAPTEQGTIEEWWAAPDQHKITYTFPSSRLTLLQTPAGKYRTKDAKRPPFQADDVLSQVIHPMPARNVLEHAIPALHQQTFGKVVLDCVQLTAPMGHFTSVPFTTNYCLTPGTSVLRLISAAGAQLTVRNAIGTFQGKQVATGVAFDYGTVKSSSGQVTTLATIGPADPALFSPTPDLVLSTDPVVPLNASVVAGRKIGGEQPVYPAGAKVQRLSGIVVLRALVSREGHISNLVAMYASDPVFVPSALEAVATWTYQPYLLNGLPTEVETTVTVNYAMGR